MNLVTTTPGLKGRIVHEFEHKTKGKTITIKVVAINLKNAERKFWKELNKYYKNGVSKDKSDRTKPVVPNKDMAIGQAETL